MVKSLEIFDNQEIKDILSEIIIACHDLSKCPRVVGFHHKFYVPGWIGFIQETIVNKNMHKWRSEVFYKGKTYDEFMFWMISSSEKLCELQISSKPVNDMDEEDMQLYKQRKKAIVDTVDDLIKVWSSVAPEVVSQRNLKGDEDGPISPYKFVCDNVAIALEDLGYPKPYVSKNTGGCRAEMRELFYRVAGMFINCLTLAAIGALISVFLD